MIYYTSDLHLFHTNIIRICNRPYASIEEMHKDLIEKWNKKVRDDDQVYILGDLSYKCQDINALYNLLKQLKGHKHLITGNHDNKWLKHIQMKDRADILETIQLYKTISDDGRMVVLFHYPIEDWDGQYHGSYHLFGHIHNVDNGYRIIPNRFNVGVDVNDFEPKTLDELIELNKG